MSLRHFSNRIILIWLTKHNSYYSSVGAKFERVELAAVPSQEGAKARDTRDETQETSHPSDPKKAEFRRNRILFFRFAKHHSRAGSIQI